jgi:hypothetical protein
MSSTSCRRASIESQAGAAGDLDGRDHEGEQRIAILDQALDRLFVLHAPGLDERVEGSKRILLLRLPGRALEAPANDG